MNKGRQSGVLRGWARRAVAAVVCGMALLATSCEREKREQIAVIPQTDGMMLWDAAHAGAEVAATETGSSIYWNAPMREDDVVAQVKLVDQIIASKRYQGLVVAPTQALSLISPVRKALARNMTTVIIDSPLSLRAGGGLSYILNDDEEGGRLAAERVAALVHRSGNVAVLGIDPDVLGVMTRARSFERTLAAKYPNVHIVARRAGSFNVLRERQVAEELLTSDSDIDVCVTLLWSTLDGLFSAMDSLHPHPAMRIVAFDLAGEPPFQQRPSLDCVIQANTRLMGKRAIEQVHAVRLRQSVAPVTLLKPVMITRENLHTPQVHEVLSYDWSLGRWAWSSTP